MMTSSCVRVTPALPDIEQRLDGQRSALDVDELDLPIFNQDWWLKIARVSSNYCELKVTDGSVVIGKLPFVLKRNRLGLVQAQDPDWSHLGGPICHFVCNPLLTYADLVRNAFFRRGFKYSTEITFVRNPTDGKILGTRTRKHRGHFRRAARDLNCVEIAAEDFVHFYETNLIAKGKRSYSDLGTLRQLIKVAASRGQARVIAATRKCAKGSARVFDAAIVYIWDRDRCYYWISTTRMASGDSDLLPHPDAIKLLAVKAMEDAQEMNLVFDADGATTSGTENLYRNIFGLKTELHRDVFQRATALEQFHQNCRGRMENLIERVTGQAEFTK